ncbi:MAG TPA: AI-2E family transporter [Candidatus Competibacteraceae bacterium]|nr:AI-2E family transporter [Candidatus Competibacteraceae bacterium]
MDVRQSPIHIEQLVTIAALVLLTLGSLMVLSPFLPALIWALIFAISTWPLFTRLESWLQGRGTLAAALLTLSFALIFLVPLGFVGVQLAEQVPRLLEAVRQVLQEGPPPAPAWLSSLPWVGEDLARMWNLYSQDLSTLAQGALPYLKQLADWLLAVGANLGQAVLQLLLSLFVLFFLYRDGRPVAQRLVRIVDRLGGMRGRRLLAVAGTAMRAVVYGVLGAAAAQGLLALIGLAIAGVPGWLFLGMAAGLLALIPIGLYMLVLLPAAGWLLMSGATWQGVFLLAWSVLVVGNVDNLIRPVLISRGTRLPLPVVLLGVLGGLITMGLIGLFVGATLLAMFYTLLKEWSAAGEEPPAAGPSA